MSLLVVMIAFISVSKMNGFKLQLVTRQTRLLMSTPLSSTAATQKPIVLLGMDEVIHNPHLSLSPKDEWRDIVKYGPTFTNHNGREVMINYSPTMVRKLNEWSTKADIKWLAPEWQTKVSDIASAIGLNNFPVLSNDGPFSDLTKRWDFKRQQAQQLANDVGSDRLIIWMEKDLNYMLPFRFNNDEADDDEWKLGFVHSEVDVRPNTIYVAPQLSLLPHHFEMLDQYVEHPELATGQSIYDLTSWSSSEGKPHRRRCKIFSFGVHGAKPPRPWKKESEESMARILGFTSTFTAGTAPDTEPDTGMKSPVDQALAKISKLPVQSSIIEQIKGTVIRDCTSTFPTFDSVAGQVLPKQLLKEAVMLPMLVPEIFTGLREPWKGILLFGPPGTGKTMLAKAAASACNSEDGQSTIFFSCSAASLTSKWVGESEKLIKCLFDAARLVAPSIIFLDEADALLSQRRDSTHEAYRLMKNEFFAQMDGLQQPGNGAGKVLVLASTNTPWDLDGAALRRLEKRVYVPLPDDLARKEQFKLAIRKNIQPRDLGEDEDVLLERLAKLSHGLSGADIQIVCKEAAMTPVRRMLAKTSLEEMQRQKKASPSSSLAAAVFSEMTIADLEEAVSRVPPSVDGKSAARYEEWNRNFGAKG